MALGNGTIEGFMAAHKVKTRRIGRERIEVLEEATRRLADGTVVGDDRWVDATGWGLAEVYRFLGY